MLIPLSWKNIWRNKVRSLVVVIAITLGITAGVFSTAFMKGMMDQRISTVINTEISHIQVHHPGFRKNPEIGNFMPNASSLAEKIERIDHVKGASKRIIIQSMVASSETASGVKITGVNPGDEKKVTNLYQKIVAGKYFEGVKRNPVVIGKKLAEKLNVKVHSKVVITLQDMDTNIIGGAFRVAGIFETSSNTFDEANIYVRDTDLARLTDLPVNAGHEIAVMVANNEETAAVAEQIKKLIPDEEVLTWKEISPEMQYITEVMDMYMYIFIIIILLALLFGIINTMLMVVLERIKEIGMLMAVGMNRLRVFGMIMLETVFLTLTGGVIGIVVGTMISKYFETHAISLAIWAEGYKQLGYDTWVYTRLNTEMIVMVTFMVIMTGFIAALYPAWKALQNDPAEALRME